MDRKTIVCPIPFLLQLKCTVWWQFSFTPQYYLYYWLTFVLPGALREPILIIIVYAVLRLKLLLKNKICFQDWVISRDSKLEYRDRSCKCFILEPWIQSQFTREFLLQWIFFMFRRQRIFTSILYVINFELITYSYK